MRPMVKMRSKRMITPQAYFLFRHRPQIVRLKLNSKRPQWGLSYLPRSPRRTVQQGSLPIQHIKEHYTFPRHLAQPKLKIHTPTIPVDKQGRGIFNTMRSRAVFSTESHIGGTRIVCIHMGCPCMDPLVSIIMAGASPSRR